MIGKAFGSEIRSLPKFVKGFKKVEIIEPDEIFSSWRNKTKIAVCQSHRDYVANLPQNFICLARSELCEIEAMKHNSKPLYGVQAHIERTTIEHRHGLQILKNFLGSVSARTD